MLKRFYLLLSLVAVVGLTVAVTNTAASQKDKLKEKAEREKKIGWLRGWRKAVFHASAGYGRG